MIHIFVFNNASRAANYGVGTYIKQLSGCLSEWSECKLSFVDFHADTKEFMRTIDEQGHTHYLIPTVRKGVENETDLRVVFYYLARNIDNIVADKLVFQFNYFQHRLLAELLKGYYLGSRIVLTVHYLSWCFELKGNYSQFQGIIRKEKISEAEVDKRVKNSYENEKRFLQLADEIIVLSKNTREILIKDYRISEDKLHVAYNGLRETSLFRGTCQPEFRNILYVGRLDEIKGVEYLIGAFKRVISKYKECHLIIVGEGNFQPYLSQCLDIHEHVSFLGKLNNEELEAIYESAYIGVIPSFHEQCSYSVIEMMRCGIPVIGTDSTGLSEMLDNTPFLRISINESEFDEEDFISQLTIRIETLLSDAEIYQEASETVRLLYSERYQVSIMSGKVKNILLSSFARRNYIVSTDYLRQMDSRMVQLINQHPDIDTEVFGLSGIGIYLWWRVLNLQQQNETSQLALLQEFLIYFLDWLYEASEMSSLPDEMFATLNDMHRVGFYITRVSDILMRNKEVGKSYGLPLEEVIIQNAIKICNCKI